jgi:hypothetical protein
MHQNSKKSSVLVGLDSIFHQPTTDTWNGALRMPVLVSIMPKAGELWVTMSTFTKDKFHALSSQIQKR